MIYSEDLDSDTVFQILEKMDAVTFAHIIADICAARGWKPRVTVADSNYIGDVVASNAIPFPESVSLVHYDDGDLTTNRLERVLNRTGHDPTSKLAVIVHNPPNEDTIKLARERSVGIVGLSDIAESVVMLSLGDLLKSYVEDSSELQKQYGDLFDEQTSDDRGSKESEGDSPESVEELDNQGPTEGFVTTRELRDAGFKTLEQEIGYLYANIRENIEELRDQAVEDPTRLTQHGEFEFHPIISELRKVTRQVSGLLSMSATLGNQPLQLISETKENAIDRVTELCETYENGNLSSASGQTPEEALFEVAFQILDATETATVEITQQWFEDH